MLLKKKIDILEKSGSNADSLSKWYKSSERYLHPHPKKMRVECSLDEDVVRWLEGKTDIEGEYPMYINHYLKKVMNNGLDKQFEK